MRAASKPLKRRGFIRQKLHARRAGFTIIEVMIVLAVTAVLFVVAALAVGGKQNETEFQQAINDTQSSFQEIISRAESGDYQEANNITCTQFGGGISVSTSAGPTSTEGTSSACMFVGKVVQFASQSDPQEYITYPIAGLRVDSSGMICTDINCANPALVAPGSSSNTTFPNDGVPSLLHNGLSVVTMQYVNGASTNPIGAFGIMSSLGVTTGSQQFYLVPISNTTTSQDPANMGSAVDAVNTNAATSYANMLATLTSSNPNYSVQICFASGTTSQSGLITIGGSGGDLSSVTTRIFSNKTC